MATWIVSGTDAAATDTDTTKTISATARNITAITKAANAQITFSASHTMLVGDQLWVASVGGMTQMNSVYHTVSAIISATIIEVSTDSTGYSTYTSGGTGTVEGTSLQNPCVVHSIGHNLSVNDVVNFSAISGTTQLNGTSGTIQSIINADSFTVNVNTTSYTRYASAGTLTLYVRAITGISAANPAVVTVTGHARATGSRIYIEGVAGATWANGKTFTLTSTGTDTFTLDGVDSSALAAYTSGGTISWMRDTIQQTVNKSVNSDTILVEKGTTTSLAGGVTFTWNRNSNLVDTSSTTVGTINVGDYIGPTTASMNGSTTTFYKVTAVIATRLTLENRFWHSDSVASISEAGCLKANAISEGLSNAAILTNSSKSITVEMGYTFADDTAPVMDSFTLYKHAVNKTASQNLGLNASVGTYRYINFADCYINFQVTGSAVSLKNYTAISPQIYSSYNTGLEPDISDFMVFSSSQSYPGHQVSNSITLGSNCYAFSYVSANSPAVSVSSGYVKNAKARVSNYGIALSASGASAEDCDSRYATDRHLTSSSSIFGWSFINCTGIGGGTYGYVTGTTSGGGLVKGCSFDGSTYGAYVTQSQSVRFEENSFANHSYDAYVDQYSGDIWFYKNTHTAPSTSAFGRATGSGGNVYIIGDTIDHASRHKLINNPQYSANQNIRAYWSLQDAFGITGQLFPYAQLIRNYGASPYTEFTFSTAPTNDFPFFLLKTPAKTGVAVDIDYSISVPSSLTANITPVVFLNGVEIQAETAISSFTTYATWTDYTITVSGGTITEDGLLEMGFKINSGAGTLYFKCNDVT